MGNIKIIAGIDVSDNNGEINWKKVKAAGVKFAILRSVRGSGKTDYKFDTNIKGVSENEIPFDVYKYTYAATEAETIKEANAVIALLKMYGTEDIAVWWDVEAPSIRNIGNTQLIKNIKAAELAIQGAGYTFGIYCNKDWYENVLKLANTDIDCRVWVARYPYGNSEKQITDVPNEVYKPVTTQEQFGWQWTSHGRIDGINGNVDMNIIYVENESVSTSVSAQECPYAMPTYTLYKGRLAQDKEYVRWLQWYLIKAGKLAETTANGKSNIDGIFGNLTDLALYLFQAEHPETYTTKQPDRKAGTCTFKALMEL